MTNKEIANQYHQTFEKISQYINEGRDLSPVREWLPILKYSSWDKFKAVIRKAVKAGKNSRLQLEYPFYQVEKKLPIGSDAQQDNAVCTTSFTLIPAQAGIHTLNPKLR